MKAALGWLVAAAVVLAAAGGAPAVAAAPAGFPAPTIDRFAPAGDRILLWNGEGPKLSVREPDGTVRVLHRAVRRKGFLTTIAEAVGTSSEIAFITEGFRRTGDGGAAWTSLRTGPLGGPYRLVAGREREGGRAQPRDAAFSRAGLLFSDDRGLVLRPSDGSAPVRLGGTGGERLAVNGRYAATRTFAHVAVLDLEARAEVARLAVEADARALPSAGVSADGAVAYVDARRRLWSFVPSTGRRTLLMRGAHAVLRVSGSTVYAVTRSSDIYDDALQRVWAVDLGGGERRPVGEAVFGGDFVTDGTRLLHRRDACVFAEDLAGPTPVTAPATAECPRQSFSLSAAEVQRRSRLPLSVTCPGAAGDRCTGTARLTAARAGRRGRVLLGEWRFDAAGGETIATTLTVRLDGAATVRRGGRSRVIARLRVTGSPYGRNVRRMVFAAPG